MRSFRPFLASLPREWPDQQQSRCASGEEGNSYELRISCDARAQLCRTVEDCTSDRQSTEFDSDYLE